MVLNALDITLMVFLPFCLIAVMNSLIVWKIWNFSRIFQVSESRTNARTVNGVLVPLLSPVETTFLSFSLLFFFYARMRKRFFLWTVVVGVVMGLLVFVNVLDPLLWGNC